MWRKHRSTFQDHVKYIHNDIVKPFSWRIGQVQVPRDHGGIRFRAPIQEATPDLLEALHNGGESRRILRDGF